MNFDNRLNQTIDYMINGEQDKVLIRKSHGLDKFVFHTPNKSTMFEIIWFMDNGILHHNSNSILVSSYINGQGTALPKETKKRLTDYGNELLTMHKLIHG